MTLTQRQNQQQKLGFRQIHAIGLLSLTNEALAEHLARRAAENPALRLRMPARATAFAAEDQAAAPGLYAHVLPQIGLIIGNAADRALAMEFLEALDPNGWLCQPVAEIAARAGRKLPEAEAVLSQLQQGIEPSGLFARDLCDCLRLQAAERGQLDPQMEQVIAHLHCLAQGERALARACQLEDSALRERLLRIRRLSPRPGLAFGGSVAPIREPDVIVRRGQGGWQVALNRSTLPALAVTDPGAAQPELRAAKSEAEWLANVLERRNRTILAVTRAVLRHQRRFLDEGASGLVALCRNEIAAELGLHHTTVGRIARSLLVETPHGLRSLCSLFDTSPQRAEGQAPPLASAAIRHRLGQLIAAENPSDPHSDAALAALLAQEGKVVARRTISKFRDEIVIPARSIRRRGSPC